MTEIELFAPAKINLALHVVGQRADGYHLLDMMVAFASVGDQLRLATSGGQGLTISGPEAADVPSGAGNIIAQVVSHFWNQGPLRSHLIKNLPVASGIGGGSADAAACFRGILKLLGESPGSKTLITPKAMETLLKIGADVPMCLLSTPARVNGIGEQITPVPDLPVLSVLLVNPRVAVSTPQVFRTLKHKENSGLGDRPAVFGSSHTLVDWLADQRNDLQAPAIEVAPAIGTALGLLRALDGCTFARMSGSGATCFGIFGSLAEAEAAGLALKTRQPDWWIAPALLDGQDRLAPQLIRSTT